MNGWLTTNKENPGSTRQVLVYKQLLDFPVIFDPDSGS
jgi:hypothetical protein